MAAASDVRSSILLVAAIAVTQLATGGCARSSAGPYSAPSQTVVVERARSQSGVRGVVAAPGAVVATPGDQAVRPSIAAALQDLVPGMVVPNAPALGTPQRVVVMHSDRPREERQLFAEYDSGITLVVIPNDGSSAWVQSSAEDTSLAPFVDGRTHQRAETVVGHAVVVREGGWQVLPAGGQNYARTSVSFQVGRAQYVLYESVTSTGAITVSSLLEIARSTPGF